MVLLAGLLVLTVSVLGQTDVVSIIEPTDIEAKDGPSCLT